MLKKSLLVVAFISTALVLTGCGQNASDNNADGVGNNAKEVVKESYIVSNPPATAKEGVKDPTTGYVKINPKFTMEDIHKGVRKIDWPTDKMAENLPPFPGGQVLEIINTDDQFCAYIANTTGKDFEDYFTKLNAVGYDIGKHDTWEDFNLQSPTVAVNLRFGQDGPDVITVRAKKVSAPAAKPEDKQ
jgi:predicted small secreted protein